MTKFQPLPASSDLRTIDHPVSARPTIRPATGADARLFGGFGIRF